MRILLSSRPTFRYNLSHGQLNSGCLLKIALHLNPVRLSLEPGREIPSNAAQKSTCSTEGLTCGTFKDDCDVLQSCGDACNNPCGGEIAVSLRKLPLTALKQPPSNPS